MNNPDNKASDANNYAQAYLNFKHEMVLFLAKRLDDTSIAEDIVHDAFVNALSHSAKVQNTEAWLKRIVHNSLVDYLRRKDRQLFVRSEQDDFADDLTLLPSQNEGLEVHHIFAQFLLPFVSALPSKYAQAITMKDFEGKSIRQISEELNQSQSAVKSRLSRGRKLLHQKLLECCEVEAESGVVIDFTPKMKC